MHRWHQRSTFTVLMSSEEQKCILALEEKVFSLVDGEMGSRFPIVLQMVFWIGCLLGSQPEAGWLQGNSLEVQTSSAQPPLFCKLSLISLYHISFPLTIRVHHKSSPVTPGFSITPVETFRGFEVPKMHRPAAFAMPKAMQNRWDFCRGKKVSKEKVTAVPTGRRCAKIESCKIPSCCNWHHGWAKRFIHEGGQDENSPQSYVPRLVLKTFGPFLREDSQHLWFACGTKPLSPTKASANYTWR